MSLQRPLFLAIVAASLSAAACGPSNQQGAAAPTAEAPHPAATPASPAPTAVSAPADMNARLLAFDWKLETATDAQGQSIAALFPAPDRHLGIVFRDGRIGVEGGCNRQSFAYSWLDATRLKLEPGMSTQMACQPPLAAADAAIAALLTGTLGVALGGAGEAPTLKLTAANGSVANFSGTPTPETRFGGPGTRVFFEVLPERGPCEDPPASERRCLMVRERVFDERGLATGTPGAFAPLQQEIEGYTGAAGVQQVVRVQRYGPPAGASGETAVHYVLDLVVESRVVAPPSAADAGMQRHLRYTCADGRTIEAHYDDSDPAKPTAHLVIDGRSFEMYSVVSASGARYATENGLTPNHGLQWWTKGPQATLSEMLMDHTAPGPVELTTCTEAKP